MLRLLFIFKEVLCSAVFTIPALLILNKLRFHSGMKTAWYLVFSLYVSAIYALVGMPNVTYIRFELNLNLLPIAGILDDLKNSILNVLLFIPMGFLLPVLCAYFRGNWKRTVFTGLLISISIELLQILTLRATDINDVITNVTGTIIGFLFVELLLLRFPGIYYQKTSGRELITVTVVTILVMFFCQPFVIALL